MVLGSRIRSLLVGSGTQSVSAFSYMQNVDYDAAQKALRRHKSAAELGKRNANVIRQVSSKRERELVYVCVCVCICVCVCVCVCVCLDQLSNLLC